MRPAATSAALVPLLLASGALLAERAEAQWVSLPGEGWLDISVFYHDTRETYGPDGERETILANGRAVTLSVFFTGAVGLIPGVDGWAQLPVHRLRFDDDAGERISSGVGDPRFFLRVGPRLLGLPSVPVALRGGVKLAGGSFDVDSEIITLGEGQSDVELMLEVGRSFHPRPLWTMAWVGRRWRGPNREAAREPGDEWFWFWSAGGQAGPLLWQTILEAAAEAPGTSRGSRSRTAGNPSSRPSCTWAASWGRGKRASACASRSERRTSRPAMPSPPPTTPR